MQEKKKSPVSDFLSETGDSSFSALPLCLPLPGGHLDRIWRAHQIRPFLTVGYRTGLFETILSARLLTGDVVPEFSAASHQPRLSVRKTEPVFFPITAFVIFYYAS
jgi:hypothetical protein